MDRREISRPVPKGTYEMCIVDARERCDWENNEYVDLTLFFTRSLGARQLRVYGVTGRHRVWFGDGAHDLQRFLREVGCPGAWDGKHLDLAKMIGTRMRAAVEPKVMPNNKRTVYFDEFKSAA